MYIERAREIDMSIERERERESASERGWGMCRKASKAGHVVTAHAHVPVSAGEWGGSCIVSASGAPNTTYNNAKEKSNTDVYIYIYREREQHRKQQEARTHGEAET